MNLQRYSIKILFTILVFILFPNNIYSQIEKVHPPNWWIGFENENLQLLVKANDISKYNVEINSPGITLIEIHNADSPNYLFLDLKISTLFKEGDFEILFTRNDEKLSYSYNLKKRRSLELQNEGFDSSDVVYLITPDRYANGNYKNDIIKGLKENKINRSDNYARHGGDIKGITKNLTT